MVSGIRIEQGFRIVRTKAVGERRKQGFKIDNRVGLL